MGQAESNPSNTPNSSTQSYHVIRVASGSPALTGGLEPFFDYVQGFASIDSLARIVEERQGREITLQVYSTKRRETRKVRVTPSSDWSKSSSPNQTPSLLGLSLRACDPTHALDQVYHVLGILANSPAESAGLVPHGDWIIGYSGGVLRGEGDFYEAVERSIDRPLQLFVYNADYDVTRAVVLVPNRDWGGEGLLGCGVGYGLLHRIPRPQDREGGILVASDEQDVFVDSTDSNRYSEPAPTRREPTRRSSDGYEEVSYTAPTNDFSASAGVEIVAKEDFDSFAPTPSYNPPPAQRSSTYGYGPSRGFGSGGSAGGLGGYSRPLSGAVPPRSPSSGVVSSSVGGAIGEEDEGEDALV